MTKVLCELVAYAKEQGISEILETRNVIFLNCLHIEYLYWPEQLCNLKIQNALKSELSEN